MSFTVGKQTAMWLVIFTVVAVVMAIIQIVRVNRPKSVDQPAEQRIYTATGPLLPVQVEVGANSFHSRKIDLNRRMRVRGTFRTAKLKTTVSVLILREADLEPWTRGFEVAPIAKTNLVPGGKLSPVLEPGIYYLVVDNRTSDHAQLVSTEFVME